MGFAATRALTGRVHPDGALRAIQLLALLSVGAAANHDAPLDRPLTAINPEPALLEREMARQIGSGDPQSFIFPRPCVSSLDSSRICGEPGRYSLRDSALRRELSVSPIGGLELRDAEETSGAVDGGLLAWGASGPLSLYLDARIFTELHEDAAHPSFDREFVERQDEDQSGSIAYSSYSRFRSNLAYDWSWGRLAVSRDAAHWGPGLFSNLAFHQDAIPFNQITFTSSLGPLTVRSLYGRLAPRTDWEMDTSTDFRSVYAHRYEWRAARNLLIGVSEQMIVYKREAPFAFNPLVPLYIAKAVEKERLNNGNIAGDACWRIPGLGAFYSEFLIDDIQSPTSLFDDQWGNKWGWMAGFHLVRGNSGIVAEYARIEPWVYTHYIPGTAQTTHFGHPLGNQAGPNSQSAIAKAYLRSGNRWYASVRLDLLWKGADRGSSVLDTHTETDGSSKAFLRGEDRPDVRFKPFLSWSWRRLGFQAEADLGKKPAMRGRIQYDG